MAHRNWNRSGQMNYYGGGMNRVSSSYSHNYGGGGGGGKQHRAIYGTVTKLFENFGYVDDEIFFMKSVVRGPLPRVGDRVMCEANYQPNMPVKWNAEMVRLLDKGGRGGGPGRSSGPISRHRPDSNRSRDDSIRDDRNKRPRPGRYDVSVPAYPFTLTEATVPLIRSRYPNLYIPSDFFQSNFRWLEVFPMHQPMKLGHNSNFYIIHRDVESLVNRGEENVLEPPDADYTYSAKVMLLATPTLAELYRRSCRLAEDKDISNDDQAYRLIQFLVGVKGRNDLMPIGGPWSPSLDGENPAEDHQVLVNTAVRTCKGLTGIDLSHCTQWFRFLELYYYRPAEKSTKTGKMREARVETVVVFVPDIWSCMPTEEDWKATRESYQELLDRKLNPPEPEPQVELMEAIDEAVDEEASAAVGEEESADVEEEQQPTTAPQEEEETPAPAQADEDAGEQKSDQPTHFAKLDPKTMKVAELKHELEVRGLSSKGLKAQLTARLTKTLEEEEAEEKKVKELADAAAKQEEAAAAEAAGKSAAKEKDGDGDAKAESEAAEAKENETPVPVELTEKERRRLERIYTLPENPMIICHPNMAAKSGKFDVQVFSLKHLLDYRMDGGAKEYTYEVSLFAEQFNLMLQRDSAFSIYKAMVVAPETSKEDSETEKKSEQAPETGEPDAKRARKDTTDSPSVSAKSDKGEAADAAKTICRTVDPALLFSFVYFDRFHAGYIIDKDLESIVHGLGLSLSRSQIRRLISKLASAPGRSSSMILYRNMTDKQVEEGTADDVTSLRMAELDDDDYVLELSMGNRALWDEDAKPMEARVKGLAGEEEMVRKVEKAENSRMKMELQFKQIREELESTRKDLGRVENSEMNMSEEIKALTEKVRNHRHGEEELRGLNATYQRLLRYSREQCERVHKEVNAQFDKEKEKRDRERERERKEKEEKEAKEKEEKGETEKEEKEGEEEAEKPEENGKEEEEEVEKMETEESEEKKDDK